MVEKIIALEDNLNLVVMYQDTFITDGTETYLDCYDVRVIGPNNELILSANKVVVLENSVAVLQGDRAVLVSGIRL